MRHIYYLLLLFLCALFLYAPSASLNAASNAASNSGKITVDIEGVDGDLLSNVQAFLNIYTESKSSTEAGSARIYRLHNQAPKQIKRALQPFGYYKVTVTKSLTSTENNWHAKYQIDKGPAIRVENLRVNISGEGEKNVQFTKIKSLFLLKPGEILNQSIYDNFKQALQKIALAEGYLNAKFITSEVQVDLKNYKANINLHFDTGPQFLFGEVRFIQPDTQKDELLDEAFLRRYIPFKQNDPYSNDALIHLQTVLSDSDHFYRIEIDQLFEEIQGVTVPLEIRVTPRKPKKYRFGLGYGTDSGARASAEHQRRVSPKGHVLTLKAKTSERINRIDMQYMMPLKNPASDQFTMTTHYLQQVTQSRKTNAGALDFRHTTGKGNWRQAVGLTYEREDYEIADDTGSSQLLMPNIDWLHSVFNNRIYPTKGSRITTEIWVSHTSWFSDVNFLQLRFNGKWILPLARNGRFIFRTNAGGTATGNVEFLPASKRFYAGGDQSIRGYGYEALGPEDNQGEIIGGKYLAVASGEYEHKIFGNWGIAAFYDAGNSFNHSSEKIYHGYGVGLRWRSAVGPIRVDLGWPADKEVKYPRFHLVIGLDL